MFHGTVAVRRFVRVACIQIRIPFHNRRMLHYKHGVPMKSSIRPALFRICHCHRGICCKSMSMIWHVPFSFVISAPCLQADYAAGTASLSLSLCLSVCLPWNPAIGL